MSHISNDSNINYCYNICTQYYRPPEILLECKTYTNKIDLWSIGCVIVEMITFDVLFNYDNNESHINGIFELFGTPTRDTKQFNFSHSYKNKFPKYSQNKDFIQTSDSKLKKILDNLLVINPADRASATSALQIV